MSEAPILFSGAMVRAILDGRKTQTRRVVTPAPEPGTDCPYHTGTGGERKARVCPYGKPGDGLWVRETFALHWMYNDVSPTQAFSDGAELVWYRSDWTEPPDAAADNLRLVGKWRPSIHMPRAACRIVLAVKAVRIERLQQITESDARAEGMPAPIEPVGIADWKPLGWFRAIWDGINYRRGLGWDEDPWVWVVEFDVMESSG